MASSPWLDHLTATVRVLREGLMQLVYPGCCLLCAQPLPAASPYFCASCAAALFTDPYGSCPRCAATVGPFAVTAGRCVACRTEKFAFAATLRRGPYQGPLREAVLHLKHPSGEGLAELLGEMWANQEAERFRALRLDVIVPVPLHWWRRWRRGYNQSAALARGLADSLHLPLQTSWLRRIRHTPLQTRQTFAGRKQNVRGAFRVRRGVRLPGKRVLLVDDVMTTGATVHEAARALRAAGASEIIVAVLTRASGG